MKKITLFLVMCLCQSLAVSVAGNEKVTYEKAMQSHRANLPFKGVTIEESQTAWDAVRHRPVIETEDNDQGGKLEELWSGRSQSVTVLWGQGDYYIEMDFDAQNKGGGLWITVDNSGLTKFAAIPSPFSFKGKYKIYFDGMRFIAKKSRAGADGTPVITRIAKFPNQSNDCAPRSTEDNKLYCESSSERTCETGSEERVCGYNGSWMAWQVISSPLCVSRRQYCP